MQSKGTIISRVLAASIAGGAIIYLLYEDVQPSTNTMLSNKELLKQSVAQLSEGLPKVVDQNTEWSSVHYSENELIHGYTLTNISIEQFSTEELNFLARELPKGLQSYVCKQKIYEKYWRRNITLTYQYTDKNGANLAKVSVTANDCSRKGT